MFKSMADSYMMLLYRTSSKQHTNLIPTPCPGLVIVLIDLYLSTVTGTDVL